MESLVGRGEGSVYSNTDVGCSSIAQRSIRTLHRQYRYPDLHPSAHWAARYAQFPIKEITNRLTYEESEYIMTECNQDMNVKEMSLSWLTKQLRCSEPDWQVEYFIFLPVLLSTTYILKDTSATDIDIYTRHDVCLTCNVNDGLILT